MRYDYSHPDLEPDEDDKQLIKEIHTINSDCISWLCPNCGGMSTRWYRQNWAFCFRCGKFFTMSRSQDYQTFLDEQDGAGAAPDRPETDPEFEKIMKELEETANG